MPKHSETKSQKRADTTFSEEQFRTELASSVEKFKKSSQFKQIEEMLKTMPQAHVENKSVAPASFFKAKTGQGAIPSSRIDPEGLTQRAKHLITRLVLKGISPMAILTGMVALGPEAVAAAALNNVVEGIAEGEQACDGTYLLGRCDPFHIITAAGETIQGQLVTHRDNFGEYTEEQQFTGWRLRKCVTVNKVMELAGESFNDLSNIFDPQASDCTDLANYGRISKALTVQSLTDAACAAMSDAYERMTEECLFEGKQSYQTWAMIWTLVSLTVFCCTAAAMKCSYDRGPSYDQRANRSPLRFAPSGKSHFSA